MTFLRRLLRRQDGITLVMAVGILGVLTVSGTTLIYYSSTNARSVSYSSTNSKAYDLAEAGINEMMAILSKPQNNALKTNLLPSTTSTYSDGTVTWSGTLERGHADVVAHVHRHDCESHGRDCLQRETDADRAGSGHALLRPAAEQPGLELRLRHAHR